MAARLNLAVKFRRAIGSAASKRQILTLRNLAIAEICSREILLL